MLSSHVIAGSVTNVFIMFENVNLYEGLVVVWLYVGVTKKTSQVIWLVTV